MKQPLSEAFVKTCDLCLKRGFEKLTEIQGCLEHQVDDDWHIILNAHSEPTQDSQGREVQPFNMMVEYQGSPVGVIGPYGGALMSGAEADFIAALDKQREVA